MTEKKLLAFELTVQDQENDIIIRIRALMSKLGMWGWEILCKVRLKYRKDSWNQEER